MRIVSAMVMAIYRTFSTWLSFHDSRSGSRLLMLKEIFTVIPVALARHCGLYLVATMVYNVIPFAGGRIECFGEK